MLNGREGGDFAVKEVFLDGSVNILEFDDFDGDGLLVCIEET
jgi:hypothetical protein